MTTTTQTHIDALVNTTLPPLPGSAMRVASLTQEMNSSAHEIAKAIGADPVFSALVMRAANSPLYCLGRSVTSLPMAVITLGDRAIYQLAIVFATADAFKQRSKNPRLERAILSHSVAVGLATREIALTMRLHGSEEAFLCGLLHDIGKLLMLRYDSKLYEPVEKCTDEIQMLECERANFGYTHAQVGALVACRWNLPENIGYIICGHHNPGESIQSTIYSRIVELADKLANIAGYGLRSETNVDIAATESAVALNLGEDQLANAWELADKKFKEISSFLC